MLRLCIVRPGSTDFDEQGRIKGALDIPLSPNGCREADRTTMELHEQPIEQVYCSPCQSAVQTAQRLSSDHSAKLKVLDKLANIDLGLWNGKRIEEVKINQPKLYRQWQDHPETVQPPGGETLEHVQKRVGKSIQKLIRKKRNRAIALVVPEPLATIVSAYLRASDLGDLWKAECASGRWEWIDIEPGKLVTA